MTNDTPNERGVLLPRGRYRVQGQSARFDWISAEKAEPILLVRFLVRDILIEPATAAARWVPIRTAFRTTRIYLGDRDIASGAVVNSLRYVGWKGDDPATIQKDIHGAEFQVLCWHDRMANGGIRALFDIPTHAWEWKYPDKPDVPEARELGIKRIADAVGGGA
jgi:hypothetical protein